MIWGSRQGFTLTELAVVLGIVGLILGSIWVAASAVYNNDKVNKAQQEIITIVQNVRFFYASNPTMTAGFHTSELISAGIFPSDIINNGSTLNPWGSTNIWAVSPDGANGISVGSNDAMNCSGGSTQFGLVLWNVPQSACIAILQAMVQPAILNNGLFCIAGGVAGGIVLTPTTAPPTLSTIQAHCVVPATGLNVQIGFSLQ